MSSTSTSADPADPLPPQTLAGKTAIVTGASRGLGASMALQLARRGASIAVCYTAPTSSAAATALAATITALPNPAAAIALSSDLSTPTGPSLLVSAAVAALGPLDILVNNAAVELQRTLSAVTPADFAAVFHTNVRGPMLLLQAALPHLRRPGRIVNVSSVGARCGWAGLQLYGGSKAALEGMTRNWAAELGGDGTTVNAVAPGPIESDMLANIPEEIVEAQKASTKVEKRLGRPGELAEVVCWLAAPESSWVSGQVINVSGGWTMY